MGIVLPVEEVKRVEEGKHEGVIARLERRAGASKSGKSYDYVDVYIRTENGIELKAGYPATITKENLLGKLIARFGGQVLSNERIDVEAFLNGKRCTFVTVTNDKGYSDILRESVKPAA